MIFQLSATSVTEASFNAVTSMVAGFGFFTFLFFCLQCYCRLRFLGHEVYELVVMPLICSICFLDLNFLCFTLFGLVRDGWAGSLELVAS